LERLCNLLFGLSNECRLRILLKLQKGAMRLAHLSEKLDLTVQETSWHPSRLRNAKLIDMYLKLGDKYALHEMAG